MRRLVRKLMILGALTGALFFSTPPPPAQADYWEFWECSQQLFGGFGSCSSEHFTCINNAGNDPIARDACNAAYADCLSGAQDDYYGCEGDPTPQPLPVIDEARSQCLQGCQNSCSEHENFADRFACNWPCSEYCKETYPKP
jgi:hypothetical protein